MWPFNRQTEGDRLQREYELRAVSFAQAIAEAVENRALAEQAGGIVDTGLAINEACAHYWGMAFASAKIETGDRARQVCIPAMLELVGREFVLSGESLFLLDFEAGALFAATASSWEVNGRGVNPASWRYRADVLGPSGNATQRATGEGVLHFMLRRNPAQPWRGEAATARAKLSRDLAAALETRLGQELAGQVGRLLAVPRDPSKRLDKDGNEIDPLEKITEALKKLSGRVAIVETTAAGWGEGRGAAPRQDWKAERIGADPPATLATLREQISEALANANGVPPSLLRGQIDGTAQRESWRRFLHGSIAPAGALVEAELSAKLEERVKLSFDGLFASDLSGRARAFQSMVKAGLKIEQAAIKSGLTMEDE